MAGWAERGLEEDAILWEFLYVDDHNQVVFADPVQIKVAWKWGATRGTSESADASAQVDREISVGSVMLYGTLQDYLYEGSATDQFLMEVSEYNGDKDVKARHDVRSVAMTFWKGKFG